MLQDIYIDTQDSFVPGIDSVEETNVQKQISNNLGLYSEDKNQDLTP